MLRKLKRKLLRHARRMLQNRGFVKQVPDGP